MSKNKNAPAPAADAPSAPDASDAATTLETAAAGALPRTETATADPPTPAGDLAQALSAMETRAELAEERAQALTSRSEVLEAALDDAKQQLESARADLEDARAELARVRAEPPTFEPPPLARRPAAAPVVRLRALAHLALVLDGERRDLVTDDEFEACEDELAGLTPDVHFARAE